MPYLRKAKDIRDEIARLDDPGSPEKCCCIHVTCSEENGHEQGKCKNRPSATSVESPRRMVLFGLSGISVRRFQGKPRPHDFLRFTAAPRVPLVLPVGCTADSSP